MTFKFGKDPALELTREQVKEQAAMMIAMARYVERFGLSCVGVQYQQGLARAGLPGSKEDKGAEAAEAALATAIVLRKIRG